MIHGINNVRMHGQISRGLSTKDIWHIGRATSDGVNCFAFCRSVIELVIDFGLISNITMIGKDKIALDKMGTRGLGCRVVVLEIGMTISIKPESATMLSTTWGLMSARHRRDI